LNALPSTDPRHVTAVEDITRHRAAFIEGMATGVFDDPFQRQHWRTEEVTCTITIVRSNLPQADTTSRKGSAL
jgi:hypothetical protein